MHVRRKFFSGYRVYIHAISLYHCHSIYSHMMNTFWGYVTGTSSPAPPSPGRNRPRTTSPKVRKPDYSISYLQDQIEELIAITGPSDGPQLSIASNTSDRLVELIRSIAETLLWGEQNEEDSMMFDYFAEKGVMKIFVSLLNSTSVAPTTNLFGAVASGGARLITIQLLQTMSLLLLNVKRQTSLYFLLSNNAINQLINNNNNLDFSDEEVLSYFISLMKSISLRLSGETIQFFVNERTPNYFPLFSQSIRFFDHHDRMVRIAVRTITLAIFKLYPESQGLRKFLQDNSGGYFSLLACQLRDLWFLMDRSTEMRTLQTVSDEMVDQLEYVAEIDRLEIGPISDLLKEKLRLYALDGVLVKGLLQILDGSDSPRLEDDRTVPGNQTILSLRLSLFVLTQLIDITDTDVWTPLLVQYLGSEEARSKAQSEIKSIGPCFSVMIELFSILLISLDRLSPLTKAEISNFGCLPPNSIELVILVAQSLSRTIESLNVKACQSTLKLLRTFLAIQSISPDFKRPVHLTLTDSFRNCAQRIHQLIGDTVLPEGSAQGNQMDYSVVDDVELLLVDSVANEANGSSADIEYMLLWKASMEPVVGLSREHISLFFLMLLNVRRIDDSTFSLEQIRNDIFGPQSMEWVDAEEINSPPTPPLDDGASNSSEACGPVADDVKEGDLIDLGKRDRIFCAYLTSSGRATRYLVLDKARLVLVAPDLVRPGFAVVKVIRPLRLYSSISVKKDDQRVLVLARANDGLEEQLGFEDAKRCHLALMHLETKRIELRKSVYLKIQAIIRSLVH